MCQFRDIFCNKKRPSKKGQIPTHFLGKLKRSKTKKFRLSPEHSFVFGGMPFKAFNRLNFAFCVAVVYFFEVNISVENSRVFMRVFVVFHCLLSPAFSVKENGYNRFTDCNRLVFGRLCYSVFANIV